MCLCDYYHEYTEKSLLNLPEIVLDRPKTALYYPQPQSGYTPTYEISPSKFGSEALKALGQQWQGSPTDYGHILKAALAEDDSDVNIDEFERHEAALLGGFEQAVANVDLASVLHLAKDRTKPPRTIGRYQLVPITGHYPTVKTILSAGSAVSLPPGITCNYRVPGGPPYLDTAQAVGFVYDETIVAVASAGISGNGLKVTQLQATIQKGLPAKDRFATGLHSGILWRDTLVEAWCDIGRQLGIGSITIQGAANNQWSTIRGSAPLYIGGDPRLARTDLYDDVAERMGFHSTGKGDWQKIIDKAGLLVE